MERVTLKIDGMSCGHCVGSVRKALETVQGTEILDVTVGSASIDFDSRVTSVEQIASAIADAGYEVRSTAVT